MKPVNSKSLFSFICEQMHKLDAKEISVFEAAAQASLAKQANNLLTYELKRALTIKEIQGTGIELREIESKSFESINKIASINNETDKSF